MLVLPVLIHLFDLRPLRRVYFSHLSMLREVIDVVDRRVRRKLRRRVVLMLRLLALASLVVAFAQPYLLPPAGIVRAERVFLYLDNSYSMMRAAAVDMSALDMAVHAAEQVVRSYERDTEYFLLTNDPSPLRAYTAEELLAQLSRLRYTVRRRSVSALVRRLDPLLRTDPSMDLYWISDFQTHLFDEGFVLRDTLHRWYILPVAVGEVNNLFIDTAYSQSPVWVRDVPNRFCVRVVNKSNSSCDPCTLRFLAEGTQQALQTAQIEKDASKVICFDYTPRAERTTTASVEVDDPWVTFDNTFYISIVMAPPVDILEIADHEGTNYIEQVYANKDRFNYQRYSSAELPYDTLYTQDLVIVHAQQRLSAALREALQMTLRAGASVVIIPSEEMDPSSYAGLLPGFARVPEEEVPWQSLAAPDYRLPFYGRVFSEAKAQVSMPSARALYRWSPRDRQSILHFLGGDAFLSYSSAQGHCYLMAAPLDEAYTDIMQHPIFVPILYKIATQAQRHSERLYYTPTDTELRVPAQFTVSDDPVFSLRSEENQRYFCTARPRNHEYLLLINHQAYAPGFYAVEQDTTLLMHVAFNLSPEESDMNFMNQDALNKYFSKVQQLQFVEETLLQGGDTLASGFYAPRVLWGYFLLATLFFLFLEMAFLRYFWRNGSNN